MDDNYAKIVKTNINKLYSNLSPEIAKNIPGKQNGDIFIFDAFGEECQVSPFGIQLGDRQEKSVMGIIISLYLLNVTSENLIIEPLKAFKDFPNSMPYVGAFATHTENILNVHTEKIEKSKQDIIKVFNGNYSPKNVAGDFSFIVYPLPKIALYYIFYKADEDFGASTKCLYSNNAINFITIDALADIGEYTSKKILTLINEQ